MPPSTLTPLRLLRQPLLRRPFSSTPHSQLARLTLVGRLAAAPENTHTSTGQDLVKYAIGTSYGPKDNRQTSWFRVASFPTEGPQKDFLLGLQKGTLVYLEGDASMRSYDDAEGKRQSSLSIVQRNIEILKRPTPKPEDALAEEGHQQQV